MKNENSYDYSGEKPQTWDKIRNIVLSLIAILSLGAFLFFSNKNEKKLGEPVSIQKYNTMEKRVEYLYYCNAVKSQILYDILVTGKMDSAFVLAVSNHVPQFALNPKDKKYVVTDIPDKNLLAMQIDSVCLDWYMSIPFMFMDAKHDSAWVLQSESYKYTVELVNSLKSRK